MTRDRAKFVTETAFLLLAITLQIVVLHVQTLPYALLLLGLAGTGAPFSPLTARKTGRTFLAVSAVLLPVLVVRLLSTPTLLPTFLEWSVYFSRLTTAALIARVYLAYRRINGLQRALRCVLAPFPSRFSEPFISIVSSAVVMIPTVVRRIDESRSAAKIRYPTGSRLTAVRATITAVLVSLFDLPRTRAEAMIVRGIIASHRTDTASYD